MAGFGKGIGDAFAFLYYAAISGGVIGVVGIALAAWALFFR